MNLGFVGAGAAGSALARALTRAGLPVVAVWSRRPERARTLAAEIHGCRAVGTAQQVVDAADLVFLAVPDDAIQAVCAALRWRSGIAVVHASGARSLDVLEAARIAGAQVGSFHPLQALTNTPGDLDRLSGSIVGIEAEEPLRRTLVDLAQRIGGRPLMLSGSDKVLYHAAAVVIANYTVTLAWLAADLMTALGLSRDDGLRALLPLLRGAVSNLEEIGLPGALTGPIARGDVATVRDHLTALARERPQLEPLYRALARPTVALAREQRLSEESAAALLALLADADTREAS